MKSYHVLVGLSTETPSFGLMCTGWPTVYGSALHGPAGQMQSAQPGVWRGSTDFRGCCRWVTEERAAPGSWHHCQRPSWGRAGMLSVLMQCSEPEGFPVSSSWTARCEVAWQVQNTCAASALYAAGRGEPCPQEPYKLAVSWSIPHVERMIWFTVIQDCSDKAC